MDLLTKIEVVTKAKNYMLEHGRMKGSYRNPKGEVCLVGSVVYANSELSQTETDNNGEAWSAAYSTYLAVQTAMMDAIFQATGDSCGPATFNDRVAESDSEVFEIFDITLANLKQQLADKAAA